MSFSSGESKLIQLPPKREEESPDDMFAQLLGNESMGPGNLNGQVLSRGDLFANYRILKFLGRGGMGEIYVAERLDDDGARRAPVALKVLSHEHDGDAEMTSRLEREAALCSRVNSKHVVQIYEYGISDEGRGYVAMELMYGQELFDLKKKHKIFPLMRLAEIGCQVLRGLHDVHRQKIVHRDIKPENIFLCEGPNNKETAKIIDFGIAGFIGDANDPLLQVTDQLLGTPQYLSPEQTQSAKVDHLTDIYAVGIILYECATGNPPFDKETPYATLLAHQNESVPLMPSTLDPEFCEIVYKALAKKPHERWQSAGEMYQVLQRWVDETSWVDDMPGGSGFSLPGFDNNHDDLFGDLLSDTSLPKAERPPRIAPREQSGGFITRNETPIFGQDPVRIATPLGTSQAGVFRKKKITKSSFNDEMSMFEEPGVAPAPSSTPDFGELPFDDADSAVAQQPQLGSPAPSYNAPPPQAHTPAPSLELDRPTPQARPTQRPAERPAVSAPKQEDSKNKLLVPMIATGVAALMVIAALLFSIFGGQEQQATVEDTADEPLIDLSKP